MTGSELLLAAMLFSFQIYADFSGYSDMAIGTAKLFGIRLTRNFNNPYFSRNISEFWRKWHISLMSWFRDYVFIPLGGNKAGKVKYFRNILIVFLLSGMWHGANWTFLAWGLYHALLFLPLVCFGKKQEITSQVAEGRFLPKLKEVGQMLVTFGLVLFGWILFRSENIHDFMNYVSVMCEWGTFRASYRFFLQSDMWPKTVFIVLMMVVEWIQRRKEHGMDLSGIKNVWLRAICCLVLALVIYTFAYDDIGTFIYFQF